MNHGDDGSFEAFVREHWASLMSVAIAVTASRPDAEDVLQTALSAAYPRWSRIRPDEALAYLRRSIVNANVSRWRRQRGREVVVPLVPEPAQSGGTDVVDARHSLLPALRALPERQRAVLVLRYLLDLPDEEIAATLGVTTVTVRSQAHRGLAALRESAAPREVTT